MDIAHLGSKGPSGHPCERSAAAQVGELAFVADQLADVEEGLADVEAKSRTATARAGDLQDATPFRDFHQKRAPDLPWQVLRIALLAVAVQWLFMMAASAAEAILGPESLLKPPGEPPWIRDQKMRSWTPEMVHLSSNSTLPASYKLFDPPVARPPLLKAHGAHGSGHAAAQAPEGSHSEAAGHGAEGHGAGGHGGHRRLAAAYGRRPDAALGELLEVLPSVGRLAEAMEAAGGAGRGAWRAAAPADGAAAALAFMAQAPRAKAVSWPVLFEPRHLLCSPAPAGHALAVALTPHGFGALVPHAEGAEGVEAKPFALEGVGGQGSLVGAAWTPAGLLLVTQAGRILRCAGRAPTGLGAWPCEADGGLPLPLRDAVRLLAAAIRGPAQGGDGRGRLVALALEGLPDRVSLFADEGAGAGWSPAGEVHLPPGVSAGSGRLGLSFAGEELLITTGQGEVHRRHLRDGTSAVHPAPGGQVRREFHAACSPPGGELLRLALRQVARPNGGLAWGPELLIAGA